MQPSFKSKRHVYHLLTAYCVKNKYFTRDELIRVIYIKYDLFKKKVLEKLKTELFFSNMISFPFHVHMSENEFDYMINSVKKTVQHFKNKIK